MTVSLTYLRTNLYKLVDQVLATGEPIVIDRKGQKLKIVPEAKRDLFATKPKHGQAIIGDPDDLVNQHWDGEWQEKDNL